MRTRVTAALVAVLALAAGAGGLDAAAVAGPRSQAAAAAAPAIHVELLARVTSPVRLCRDHIDDAVATERGIGLPAGSEAGIFAGVVAVILVLLLAALWQLARARRRGRGARRAQPAAGRSSAAPSTQELAAQASAELVETDDAVRTSEQELGFATARFGEHAAQPFSAAVREARAEMAAAFRLRQLLDDGTPEDEATRPDDLIQISEHCARASQALDEQAEAFDQLQDLPARAPELTAEVDAHVAQLSARLGTTRQTLARLAGRYTPDAIAAVAANPDQAAGRLDFAGTMLADAQPLMAEGQPGEAAILLQAAESSADQATDLLDGVEHAEAELTQAASALPAALREIDAEIGAATDLLAARRQEGHARRRDNGRDRRADDGHDGLIAHAQAVAADVRAQQTAGHFDALAALRDVQRADSALDHILASGRDDRDRRERARAVLDQAMLVARSSVTAAGDFITTRRGRVGAEARTRLAQAQGHFQQAIGKAQADPEVAVTETQYADALALQAHSAAEADVMSSSYPQAGSARHDGVVAGLDSGPASFGGRLTRGRRGGGKRFAAISDTSANRGRHCV